MKRSIAAAVVKQCRPRLTISRKTSLPLIRLRIPSVYHRRTVVWDGGQEMWRRTFLIGINWSVLALIAMESRFLAALSI